MTATPVTGAPAPAGTAAMAEPLSGRAVKAGAWVFSLRALERLLGFVRMVVLARLLSPRDFGLFGIALMVFTVLDAVSQTGAAPALIHKRGDLGRYLDTAWTLQLLRALALALLILALAVPAARFFAAPAAAPLFVAFAVGIGIQGLTNTGVIHFDRDLRFGRRSAYLLSGTIAELVVAVVAAILLRSAWALMLGYVAGQVVRVLASYVVHPYRPRFRLAPVEVRELARFGRWVLLSGAVIAAVTEGDNFVVGRLLGAAALGLYQLAYTLASLPATQITHVVSEAAFPAYAALGGDRALLKEAWLKVVEGIALIALPISVAIFGLAPEFVALFLGAAWAPIVAPVRVLACLGALRALGAAHGALFNGSGHPRDNAVAGTIHLVLLAVLIVPAVQRWGITGAALAATAPLLVVQAYSVGRAAAITGATLGEVGSRLVGGCGAALLLAAATWAIKVSPAGAALRLALVATAVAAIGLWALRRTFPEQWLQAGAALGMARGARA